MSAGIPITCPHCGRRVKLKSAAALGKVKPCPGCGEPFRLEADEPDDPFAEAFTDDDFTAVPAAAPPPRVKRAGSRPPSRQSSGSSRKRRQGVGGEHVWLWAGGGLGVLVVCGGCLTALLVPALRQARDAARRVEARQEAAVVAAATPPAPVVAGTEEQARTLGEAVVRAFNAGDRERMADLLDADALVQLAIADMDLTEADRRNLIAGFTSTRRNITGSWVQAVEGGSARLLGVIEREGAPAALARLLPPAGGVAYMAFFPTGDGRIADAYVFASGERLSTSMRRLFGAGIGGTNADRAALARLEELKNAILRRDGVGALRIYEGLPRSIQDTRLVQVSRVQATSLLGDPARYEAVLADIDRRFPNDPSMDLMKVDYYANDPDMLIAVLSRLDAALDGDPFLRGLLAEQLAILGRDAEALEVARSAVAEEPGLAQVQSGLMAAEIAAGDHEAAADALRALRDEHGIVFEPEGLRAAYPRGGAFADSPAFRRARAEPPPGFGGR